MKEDLVGEEIGREGMWDGEDNGWEEKVKEGMVSVWGDGFKE